MGTKILESPILKTSPKRKFGILSPQAKPIEATKKIPAANDIVAHFIHGATSSVPLSSLRLIHALQAGLPVAELEELRSSLDLPMEKLVPMLGISKATWHRRKAAGRLDPSESDRVIRFARLFGTAVKVMESIVNARLWLASPQVGLGGVVPFKYAETEVGAREVEDLLGRIEYGVYS